MELETVAKHFVNNKFALQTRVANLLGVAGTDIPIENIQKLMVPYRVCSFISRTRK